MTIEYPAHATRTPTPIEVLVFTTRRRTQRCVDCGAEFTLLERIYSSARLRCDVCEIDLECEIGILLCELQEAAEAAEASL